MAEDNTENLGSSDDSSKCFLKIAIQLNTPRKIAEFTGRQLGEILTAILLSQTWPIAYADEIPLFSDEQTRLIIKALPKNKKTDRRR